MTADQLVAAAIKARSGAYAPYSKYFVGAALAATDGRVFTGVNVENASYGLTICAERTAVTKAVSEGALEFDAIAVVTENGASMCGACRQVVSEFVARQGRDIPVYFADPTGAYSETTISALLPGAFTPGSLDD